MSEESVKIGDNRQPNGTFGPNNVANPNGRPTETEEQKIIKKAVKQLVSEYKERLAEALPKIEPVLIEKAIAGDIQFIKELHDRAMGKPEQQTDFTSGGKPIPLLYALPNNNSDKENPQPEEKN